MSDESTPAKKSQRCLVCGYGTDAVTPGNDPVPTSGDPVVLSKPAKIGRFIWAFLTPQVAYTQTARRLGMKTGFRCVECGRTS